MGTAVMSPRSAVRREAVLSYMTDLAPDAVVAVVAPDRDAGMALLRHHGATVGALFGWEALTLRTLATRIALPAMATAGVAPATGMLRQSLCAHVVEQARADGRLNRFSAVAGQPGFPRCLADTFDELAMEAVSPEDLAGADADLAGLFSAYHNALGAAGLTDAAGVFARAEQALQAGAVPRLAGRPLDALVFYDVPLHHRREGLLATRLLASAKSRCCVWPTGDERTGRWLARANVGATRSAPSPQSGAVPSALQRLQASLFEEAGGPAAPPAGSTAMATTVATQPTAQPPAAPEAEVQVLSAPGESRECVELARRLLWAAEAGTPFERMAILPRRSRTYHDVLRAALVRAGIPAYFSANGRRPDPSGRALLSLLACRDEGLSARRFAEYLSLSVVPRALETHTGPGSQPGSAQRETFAVPVSALHPPNAAQLDALLPLADDGLETTADVDAAVADGGLRRPTHWERLLGEAAVIGGADRWRLRLDGLRESLQLGLSHRTARGEDAGDVQLKLADLQHLRDFALPIIGRLADLPTRADWTRWQTELTGLAVATLRRPERVLAVIAEASPLAALGEVGLDDVQRALREPLQALPAPQQGGAEGKVFVGDASEARGRVFDIVCIPGLCEKVFPEKLREDPLLLDAVRGQLGDGLVIQRDRAAWERLHLRLAAGAATRQLILSYPRLDSERARARVPSFYGLELLRAAEGRLPGYAEMIARAERTAETRLGWPAPASPLDAIDAAEHDLAALEAPLSHPHDAQRGGARYLLQANPHLARALRFRARRWALAKFTAADGLVDPGAAVRAALAAHRPGERPYSATALEAYASCPYRFFLKAIVGLRSQALPAPIERLGPLEAGALFHSVQREVLNTLQARGELPLHPDTLPTALATLDEALDGTAARYRARLVPAVERVFADGVEALRVDLRQWLTRCADAPEWVPTHFELAFGLGAAEDEARDRASTAAPLTLPLPKVALSLRGAIDLVEQRDGRLRATDHKTGGCTLPEELRIGGGSTLQPALYGLALKALFPGQEVDSGRLYFCTTRGGFETRTVPIDGAVEAAITDLVEHLDHAITTGFLPAAPADGACEHCDYRAACGPYESQRVQRKRPERLHPLHALRRQP